MDIIIANILAYVKYGMKELKVIDTIGLGCILRPIAVTVNARAKTMNRRIKKKKEKQALIKAIEFFDEWAKELEEFLERAKRKGVIKNEQRKSM